MEAMLDTWGVTDPSARAMLRARLHARLMERVAPAAAAAAAAPSSIVAAPGAGFAAVAAPCAATAVAAAALGAPASVPQLFPGALYSQLQPQPSLSAPAELPCGLSQEPDTAADHWSQDATKPAPRLHLKARRAHSFHSRAGPAQTDSPRSSDAAGGGGARHRSNLGQGAVDAHAEARASGGRCRGEETAAAIQLLKLAEPGTVAAAALQAALARSGHEPQPAASDGPHLGVGRGSLLQAQPPHHATEPTASALAQAQPEDDRNAGMALQPQVFKRRLFPRSKLLPQRSVSSRSVQEEPVPELPQRSVRRDASHSKKQHPHPQPPQQQPQEAAALLPQLAAQAGLTSPAALAAVAAAAGLPLSFLQEQLQAQLQVQLGLPPPLPLAPPQGQPIPPVLWDALGGSGSSGGGGGGSAGSLTTPDAVNQLLNAAAALLAQQQQQQQQASAALPTAAPPAAVATLPSVVQQPPAPSAPALPLTHLVAAVQTQPAPGLQLRQQSGDMASPLFSCMPDGVPGAAALPPLLLRSLSDRGSFSSSSSNVAAALLGVPQSPHVSGTATGAGSLPPPRGASAAMGPPLPVVPPQARPGAEEAARAALARACQARLALQSLLDDDALASERGRAFLPSNVAASLNQAVLLLDSHLLRIFGERAAAGGGKVAPRPELA
jgi:hypothetical protein